MNTPFFFGSCCHFVGGIYFAFYHAFCSAIRFYVATPPRTAPAHFLALHAFLLSFAPHTATFTCCATCYHATALPHRAARRCRLLFLVVLSRTLLVDMTIALRARCTRRSLCCVGSFPPPPARCWLRMTVTFCRARTATFLFFCCATFTANCCAYLLTGGQVTLRLPLDCTCPATPHLPFFLLFYLFTFAFAFAFVAFVIWFFFVGSFLPLFFPLHTFGWFLPCIVPCLVPCL